MQNELNELKKIIKQLSTQVEQAKVIIGKLSPDKSEFEILKELLNSNAWPKVSSDENICNFEIEDDKLDRAEGILSEAFNFSLEGKSLLDFGCGEGHTIIKAMSQGCDLGVGYDITAQGKSTWSTELVNKTMLTTSREAVAALGPYDHILLYDVMDHLQGDVDENIDFILSVSKPDAKFFIRCHPWCSRHGGHLYNKINKAYAHLVFTDEELKQLELTVENIKKVIKPLATYSEWLKKIPKLTNKVTKEIIEPFFFDNKLIHKRILLNWNNSGVSGWPEFQLSQVYIDYFN